MQDAPAVPGQRRGQVQAGGNCRHPVGQHHLIDRAVAAPQRVLQRARRLAVVRRIGAHHQLRAARYRTLRVLVAIQAGLRRGILPVALERRADQLAFQHGTTRADHQGLGRAPV
ncbi:hypothetical protein G6F50_016788 [Rhizopus delemar]|uniref:Uncharacterized protein n=1 Tax=Rhizopus delemar TaxID=936053 RepID=A0A9P7C0N9_9FUNG|nr:hypothetical protein G6F50_016788 [Rhizopus delemar]